MTKHNHNLSTPKIEHFIAHNFIDITFHRHNISQIKYFLGKTIADEQKISQTKKFIDTIMKKLDISKKYAFRFKQGTIKIKSQYCEFLQNGNKSKQLSDFRQVIRYI